MMHDTSIIGFYVGLGLVVFLVCWAVFLLGKTYVFEQTRVIHKFFLFRRKTFLYRDIAFITVRNRRWIEIKFNAKLSRDIVVKDAKDFLERLYEHRPDLRDLTFDRDGNRV
ncbi:MAG: hypothetical protein FWC67_03745 [Defluviitaleaceae bacterium]|nr:hypothetical protein [Defluviitaleaceae bacterium]